MPGGHLVSIDRDGVLSSYHWLRHICNARVFIHREVVVRIQVLDQVSAMTVKYESSMPLQCYAPGSVVLNKEVYNVEHLDKTSKCLVESNMGYTISSREGHAHNKNIRHIYYAAAIIYAPQA